MGAVITQAFSAAAAAATAAFAFARCVPSISLSAPLSTKLAAPSPKPAGRCSCRWRAARSHSRRRAAAASRRCASSSNANASQRAVLNYNAECMAEAPRGYGAVRTNAPLPALVRARGIGGGVWGARASASALLPNTHEPSPRPSLSSSGMVEHLPSPCRSLSPPSHHLLTASP